MARRKIQNARLPKPDSTFTGSRHRNTVLGQGSGEIGQNTDTHMDGHPGDGNDHGDPWDDYRDYNGTFRGNCFDPLPDFE